MSDSRILAVLIDGDNISAETIQQIWEQLRDFGELRFSRVFHNKNSINQWEEFSRKSGIKLVFVPNNVPKKNSVDIALVMEAMTLHYERSEITGFCIIASDSDYTGLASHLKERGKYVLGIGKENTPESFQNACTKFVDINDLLAPAILEKKEETVQATSSPASDNDVTDYEFLKWMIEAYGQLILEPSKKQTPQGWAWIDFPSLIARMQKLNPELKLSIISTVKRVELFANAFPNWFQVQAVSPKKPGLYRVSLMGDLGIFQYLTAYIYLISEGRSIDGSDWVSLSAIAQATKILFPNEYPVKYKNVVKPGKVIEHMSQDFPKIIQMQIDTQNTTRVQFKI